MPISNTPFSSGAIIPGDGSLIEIFRVDGQNESATVNLRVISMDLTVDYMLHLALVPIGTANNATLTNDQYLQPKNIKLGPNGINAGFLEDTGIIVPNGMKIVAKANALGLVARAHGYYRTITVNL